MVIEKPQRFVLGPCVLAISIAWVLFLALLGGHQLVPPVGLRVALAGLGIAMLQTGLAITRFGTLVDAFPVVLAKPEPSAASLKLHWVLRGFHILLYLGPLIYLLGALAGLWHTS